MLRLLCLFLLLGLSLAQTDRTVEDRATGVHVVDGVVDKIQKSCIFSNDKMLLKRVALVESLNGLNANAFRDGYHGGIWQVNEAGFKATKTSGLSSFYSKIKTEFNIDWESTTWKDLTKPLFSGIAARLRIHLMNADIPWGITDQATYWKDRYTTNSDSPSKEQFKSLVDQFETVCNMPKADLYFVLDTSGSIGATNFATMKQFVVNMVKSFTISASAVRIGVITFSTDSKVEFSLTKYTNESDIVNAVNAISYRQGGTETAKGLDDLRKEMEKKARPVSSGVPRIAIVLTDGRSSSESKTAEAARKVHADDVTMLGVGVTTNIIQKELNAIGSDPDCLHVFNLVTFSDIPHFKNEIARRSCRVSAIVDESASISGSLEYGQAQYFRVKVKKTIGITLKVSMSVGSSAVYVSYSNPNPSEALFDYKRTVDTTMEYGTSLFIPPRSTGIQKRSTDSTEQAYVSVTGTTKGTANTFKMDTLPGDHSGAADVIMSITLTLTCLVFALFA